MKKLALLFAMISLTGIAQKAKLGPQFGMNLIQLEKEDHGRNFHPGWYGGAAFDYDFNNWLSIQTGIMYSQKRQTFTDSDTTAFDFFGLIDSSFAIEGIDLNTYTKIEGRTSQHYFDVPIMASFKYKGMSLNVGGYVGFMFTARTRQKEITNTPFIQTIDPAVLIEGFTGTDSTGGSGGGGFGGFDVNSLISSLLPAGYEEEFTEATGMTGLRIFDYGVRANIGYQPNQFGVYAGYQFGIPDYRKSPTEKTQRHHFVQFSIRYMFGLGKNLGNPSLN